MLTSRKVCVTEIVVRPRRAAAPPRPFPAKEVDEDDAVLDLPDAQRLLRNWLVREAEMPRSTSNYMDTQPALNWTMRRILVEWMCKVCNKFKFGRETVFLAVNLADRYLSLNRCARHKLQLVSCAAMLLASKYEEIYFSEVADYVYISDRAYTCEQIMDMESQIVASLDWELTVPTPYHFLTWLVKELDIPDHVPLFMARCALVHEKLVATDPSEIACACVVLAARHGHKLAKNVPRQDSSGLQQKILELTGLDTDSMSDTLRLVAESLTLKHTAALRQLNRISFLALQALPPP